MEFNNLPIEVHEHIFSYLDTANIINLSKLSDKFDSICSGKKLVSKINCNRDSGISASELCNFVSKKPRYDFITVFNINCMYWIPAADLRKCISKMESLECLYAIDTKLSLLKPDFVLYKNLSKLQRLGISVSQFTFHPDDIDYYFPRVTHFYLHVDSSSYCIVPIMSIINKLNTIKELWFIESGTLAINRIDDLMSIPDGLQKFVCCLFTACSQDFGSIYDRDEDMQSLFKTSARGSQAVWERDPCSVIPLDKIPNQNEHWKYLLTLYRCYCMFSVKQAKALMLGNSTLNDIYFDELNFSHWSRLICDYKYKDAVRAVVLCANMRLLTKLSLHFCVLEDDCVRTSRKRKLKGENSDWNLILRISENCPNIEELEFWNCESLRHCHYIDFISSVVHFRYLKKLTLDNMPNVYPKFLVSICASCKNLSSLRIRSKQNSNLHGLLCLALQKTVSLKDLRYEHECDISIDKLLEALMKNKSLKLDRLFVKCKSVEIFSLQPFQSFLRTNPELRFLYVIVKDLPKAAIALAMKLLESFQSDPRKIIVLAQDEFAYCARTQIPSCHMHEMVKCDTNVSVVDVFGGYLDD